MADNIKTTSYGKVIVVDPNKVGSKSDYDERFMVPLEDLSINVELTALKRERSTIVINSATKEAKVVSTPKGNFSINFIDGTDIKSAGNNGPNKSLTTNYAEIDYRFSQSGKNHEALGITNIDIEFNSSYAPMIKIDMVDVRGGSIFGSGMKSNYNVFFDLPYPMFNLKIKGYYGHQVSYCLHLVKFTSKFNAKTGNFDIRTEFVGYTYAFLSDMLVGYLRAVVETGRGGDIFTRIVSELGNKPHLKKLNDFIRSVESLNTTLPPITRSSASVKETFAAKKALDATYELKYTYDDLILQIENSSGEPDDNKGLITFVSGTSTDLTGAIQTYNTNVRTIIDGFKSNLPSDLQFDLAKSQLTPDKIFPPGYITPPFAPSKKAKFDLTGFINELYDKQAKINKLYETAKITAANEIANQISNNLGFSPYIKNIFEIFTVHCEVLLERIRDVANSAKNSSTRKNILKAHLSNFDIKNPADSDILPFPAYTDTNKEEAWLGSIQNGREIEEVKFVEELIRGLQVSATIDRSILAGTLAGGVWGPVNPFDTTLYNKTNPYSQVELSAVADARKLTRIILRRAITFLYYTLKLPKTFEIKTMAEIEANSCFSALNSTVRDKLISFFNTGKFDVILKSYIADSVSTYDASSVDATSKQHLFLTALNNVIYADTNNIKNPTTNVASLKTYSPIFSQNPSNTAEENKVLNGNKFRTGGIINSPTKIKIDLDGSVYFANNCLPIYPITNKIEYFLANNTDLIDDGSQYIDLIKPTEYDEEASNFGPAFDDILIRNKLETDPATINMMADRILNRNDETQTAETTRWRPFQGTHKTQEFRKAKYEYPQRDNEEIHPIKYTFYYYGDDALGGNNMGFTYIFDNKNVNVNLGTDFKLLGYNGQRDLFGSRWYYNQKTIEAKAFLFLHTIPFRGMLGKMNFWDNDSEFVKWDTETTDDDNRSMLTNSTTGNGLFRDDKIRGLFSERAGFVFPPKSWVLFVGALLWRIRECETKHVDPITFAVNSINLNTNAAFTLADAELLKIGLGDKDARHYLRAMYSDPANAIGDKFRWGLVLGDSESHGYGEPVANIPLERIFFNFPEQVKNKFIDYFTGWVRTDFTTIKDVLEIYVPTITDAQIVSAYNSPTDQTNNPNIFNLDVLKNLKTPISKEAGDKEEYKYNYRVNFNTDVTTNTGGIIDAFLNDVTVVVNSTWRIWNNNSTKKPNKLESAGAYHNTQSVVVDKTTVGSYLEYFITEFKRLKSESDKNPETSNDQLVNINDDNLKLSVYRTIKAIYDKWICGGDGKTWNACRQINDDGTMTDTNHIIDSFKFITRSYENIGEELLINPQKINELMIGNFNQSFYDLIGRVLADNYMDFIPLPAFINFKEEEQLKKMFTPYSYREIAANTTINPTFVCVYLGQRSQHLDTPDSAFSNDGIDLTMDERKVPGDFYTKGGDSIPVFIVNYANESQSIFKDITLDQQEFTETDEGLKIINDLVNNTLDVNKTWVGQNLFNLYSVRSYSCEVECLGNATIQPMMYFQLNNIPMFRGAYWIIKTSHSIIPNHMTTRFKGVRIKEAKTPLLTNATIFVNYLSTINITDLTGVVIGGTAAGSSACNKYDCNTKGDSATFMNYLIGEFQKPPFNLTLGAAEIISAGFAGNAITESKYCICANNPSACVGGCFGIMQWEKGRWDRFGKPLDGASFVDQLGFIITELRTTEKSAWNKIKTTTTVSDAAFFVAKYYERCSECNEKTKSGPQERIRNAENVYATKGTGWNFTL